MSSRTNLPRPMLGSWFQETLCFSIHRSHWRGTDESWALSSRTNFMRNSSNQHIWANLQRRYLLRIYCWATIKPRNLNCWMGNRRVNWSWILDRKKLMGNLLGRIRFLQTSNWNWLQFGSRTWLLCRISHLWIFRWKSKRIRTYLMINFNQYYQIYNMNG